MRRTRESRAALVLTAAYLLVASSVALAKKQVVPQHLDDGLRRSLAAPDMTARAQLPTYALDVVSDKRVRRTVATIVDGRGSVSYKMVGGMSGGLIPLVPQDIQLNQASEAIHAGARIRVQSIDFDSQRLEITVAGSGVSQAALIRLLYPKGWETYTTADQVMERLSSVLTLGASHEARKRLEREYLQLLERLETAFAAYRVANLPPHEEVRRAQELRLVLVELVANLDSCKAIDGQACEGGAEPRSMLGMVNESIARVQGRMRDELVALSRDRVTEASRARDGAVGRLQDWMRDDSRAPGEGADLVEETRERMREFDLAVSELGEQDVRLSPNELDAARAAGVTLEDGAALVERRRVLAAEAIRRGALMSAHDEATALSRKLAQGASSGGIAERARWLDQWDDLVDRRVSMIRDMEARGDPTPLAATTVIQERDEIHRLRGEIGTERRTQAERARLDEYRKLAERSEGLRGAAMRAAPTVSLAERERAAESWAGALDDRDAALRSMRAAGQEPAAETRTALAVEESELSAFRAVLLAERNAGRIADLDAAGATLETAYLERRTSYVLAFQTDRQAVKAAELGEALVAFLLNRRQAASLGSVVAARQRDDLDEELSTLRTSNSNARIPLP